MDVEASGRAFDGWNDFLSRNAFGTFFQTSFYADYAEREAGLKPFFLRAEENGRTAGQLLLLKGSRAHGLLANAPFSRATTKIARSLLPAFHWVYGPVAESEEAALALLKKAAAVSKGKIRECSPHPLEQFENAFTTAGFKQKKWGTFIVDLSQSEEELWKNVDHSARKLANRTLEQVEVKQVETEGEFKEFHGVLNENRKRGKVRPYRYSPLLWKIWRESGTGAVFIAREKTSNRVLAGLGISFFNGYLNEWGAGTSNYAIENHVYAQDAIKWSVVKWAKGKNFRFFDLTGVNPNPQDEKENGIFRFKEKWGGKLVEYSAWSLQ
ncbi:peptidoglycan bridge formation glycyltransferase FemA/FemB family protein [Candidatus Micrarchaeota archaeon]|nr:peptidoglycan bridge formation glycyltransferase FemA/FemB family protein [Candidatus Micrarchaeota archaeon]